MPLTFFTHNAYDAHRMHDGHPERPERTRAILAHLRETGQLAHFDERKPRAVSRSRTATRRQRPLRISVHSQGSHSLPFMR